MNVMHGINRLTAWADAQGKWICSNAATCPRFACEGQTPHYRENCESGCHPHGYPIVSECVVVEEPAYMRIKN
jgi:hypothetical protein